MCDELKRLTEIEAEAVIQFVQAEERRKSFQPSEPFGPEDAERKQSLDKAVEDASKARSAALLAVQAHQQEHGC